MKNDGAQVPVVATLVGFFVGFFFGLAYLMYASTLPIGQ